MWTKDETFHRAAEKFFLRNKIPNPISGLKFHLFFFRYLKATINFRIQINLKCEKSWSFEINWRQRKLLQWWVDASLGTEKYKMTKNPSSVLSKIYFPYLFIVKCKSQQWKEDQPQKEENRGNLWARKNKKFPEMSYILLFRTLFRVCCDRYACSAADESSQFVNLNLWIETFCKKTRCLECV